MAGRSENASLIMMIFTAVSRLLGILKSRMISLFFGAGGVADAINFSYNLANNFRKLFAEGSLSSSYLPLFSRSNEDRERTCVLYSQLVCLLIIIFLTLFILVFLFSRNIIGFLSDFESAESSLIASSLLPWFVIFLFFISLSILVAGILQCRGRFFASAFSPIVFTLSILLSIPLLSEELAHYSMAIGVVCGAIGEFLVVFVAFKRLDIPFHFNFHFKSPDFVAVMRHWLPSSISSLVAIISQSLTFYIASSLAEGSVSAISNAIIFYQAPFGIFYASISSVYFPLFAKSRSEEERARELSKALNYLFTFLLPSCLILATLSAECISVLLQKGAFTLENTMMTAGVLKYYAFAMIPLAFYSILQRYLYSLGRYYVTLLVSLFVTAFDVGLSLLLISMGWGVEAISFATIFSSLFGFVVSFAFVKDFRVGGFLKKIVRICFANVPLLLVCAGYKIWNPDYYVTGSTLKNFGFTVVIGLALLAVAALGAFLFKLDFLSGLRRKPR